jgi:hypothetical protein
MKSPSFGPRNYAQTLHSTDFASEDDQLTRIAGNARFNKKKRKDGKMIGKTGLIRRKILEMAVG